MAKAKPGVHSWNSFMETLALGDVDTVADAVAKVIKGKVQSDVYEKTVKLGKRAYVVARPKGLKWCNVIRIAPPRSWAEEEKKVDAFCKPLAKALGAAVMWTAYNDTADFALFDRYEPDGSINRSPRWDLNNLTEYMEYPDDEVPKSLVNELAELQKHKNVDSTGALDKLAKAEKFSVAAIFFDQQPKSFTVEFEDQSEENFDGIAFISN